MCLNVKRCIGFFFLSIIYLYIYAGAEKKDTITETEVIYGKGTGLSSIRSIAKDSKLNLYVLDHRNCHIMVFNENGSLKAVIGRKGQGPGEYSAPASLEINKDDQLIVYDTGNRRITMLNTDGGIIKEVSTARFPRLFTIRYVSEGVFVGGLTYFDEEQKVDELISLDINMEKTATIARMESKPDFGVLEIYPSTLRYGVISEREVIWGDWLNNKVFISEITGLVKDTIILPFKRTLISENDKDLEIKRRFGQEEPDRKVVFPKYFPFYWSFLFADNHLYFISFERGPGSGRFCHILNLKNRNLERVLFNHYPLAIYSETYFSSSEDEDGSLLVRRTAFSTKRN